MSELAHRDLKEQARQRVTSQQPRLEELNLWLHDNPETAYEEYQSSARLAQVLETMRERGVVLADRAGWVRASPPATTTEDSIGLLLEGLGSLML